MTPVDELYLDDSSKPFEDLWRELDALEEDDASAEPGSTHVRLDCNGELVGVGSVVLTGVRHSKLAGDLIEFVCPLCNERHESLAFG